MKDKGKLTVLVWHLQGRDSKKMLGARVGEKSEDAVRGREEGKNEEFRKSSTAETGNLLRNPRTRSPTVDFHFLKDE